MPSLRKQNHHLLTERGLLQPKIAFAFKKKVNYSVINSCTNLSEIRKKLRNFSKLKERKKESEKKTHFG